MNNAISEYPKVNGNKVIWEGEFCRLLKENSRMPSQAIVSARPVQHCEIA
ncbi:MAG: hypothetical protein LBS83_03190 [Holosporales bacterium]|jgi:hypothetical protein|nr:hypothetical protein [Holosporales bacterium]